MPWRVIALWVVGLLTIVPYCLVQLIWHAEPADYPLLIVVPLFWIFGFWPVVGPIVMICRVRAFMTLCRNAKSLEEIREIYRQHDGKAIAIDFIAREARIPRFLANRVYDHVVERLIERADQEQASEQTAAPSPSVSTPQRNESQR